MSQTKNNPIAQTVEERYLREQHDICREDFNHWFDEKYLESDPLFQPAPIMREVFREVAWKAWSEAYTLLSQKETDYLRHYMEKKDLSRDGVFRMALRWLNIIEVQRDRGYPVVRFQNEAGEMLPIGPPKYKADDE